MMVVSPWSRGGWVDSQVFDHTSVIRFLEVVTGVHEPNISSWRRDVCGDLTSALDFTTFDPSVPALPDIDALVAEADREKSLPPLPPPPPGPRSAPVVERGTRRHRPLPYQPNANASADRASRRVTLSLTTTGRSAQSFAVYSATSTPFTAIPVLVGPGETATHTADAAADGSYELDVYGPNGFLRSFAGTLVAAGNRGAAVPAVTAVTTARSLHLHLANQGHAAITFTLTGTDHTHHRETHHVAPGATVPVGWPTPDGWYDVTVTADDGSAFAYRYAGRLEPLT
jgi:phospholipase C